MNIKKLIPFSDWTFLFSRFFVIVIGLIIIQACTGNHKSETFTGMVFGTNYRFEIVDYDDKIIPRDKFLTKIDSLFHSFNQQMSTYDCTSEISEFNRLNTISEFTISNDFLSVVKRAEQISELTDGAFDITVLPLINRWGFGPFAQRQNEPGWEPPLPGEIITLLDRVHYSKISTGSDWIKKSQPDVQIDLNAIAKGFSVDKVYDLFYSLGFRHFLVEIGGEIRSSGLNVKGDLWQIGIDLPEYETLPGANIISTVSLNNQALATSGDYRNYFIWLDKKYSHAIDPVAGYPVQTQIASATVVTKDCINADALATALMVLGLEYGIKLIESLPDTEALIIKRDGENYIIEKTKNFPAD